MYHVSAQGVDERMINVDYYYYSNKHICTQKDFFKENSCANFVLNMTYTVSRPLKNC